LSIYANLLLLCDRSDRDARRYPRHLPRHKTPVPMPSMGRWRTWSRLPRHPDTSCVKQHF